MLSYSNFGSSEERMRLKCANAAEMLHKSHPELIVDGEIQANFALNSEMRAENFPFSSLKGKKGLNTLNFSQPCCWQHCLQIDARNGRKGNHWPHLTRNEKVFSHLTNGFVSS